MRLQVGSGVTVPGPALHGTDTCGAFTGGMSWTGHERPRTRRQRARRWARTSTSGEVVVTLLLMVGAAIVLLAGVVFVLR